MWEDDSSVFIQTILHESNSFGIIAEVIIVYKETHTLKFVVKLQFCDNNLFQLNLYTHSMFDDTAMMQLN